MHCLLTGALKAQRLGYKVKITQVISYSIGNRGQLPHHEGSCVLFLFRYFPPNI